MVEQSSEPFLSSFPLLLAHTAPSLGHSFPALCRARVGLSDVLLGPRPSLPCLRRRLILFVRQVHRYYGAVRLLRSMPVRCTAYSLFGPVSILVKIEKIQRSPGSRACCFSACAGSQTTQSRPATREFSRSVVLPSRSGIRSASLVIPFRSSIARPTDALVYASTATSRQQSQDSGSGWSRCLLSCRALSSPTTCRFNPAHPRHRFELRFTAHGDEAVRSACALAIHIRRSWHARLTAACSGEAHREDRQGAIVNVGYGIFACGRLISNTFSVRDRGIAVSMAKHLILFPRPPQPDPDEPIKFATFQVRDSRLVLDLRGPEPEYRTDPADVISIKTQPKRGRRNSD